MSHNLFRVTLLTLCSLFIFSSCSNSTEDEKQDDSTLNQTVYVGTYTQQGSQGIYVYSLNLNTGKLTQKYAVGSIQNPSFLALDSQYQNLYAVSESGNQGAVAAFKIDQETGNLSLLNQVSSNGMHPCHVEVDAFNENIIVSNYSSGNIAIYPILEGGSLGTAGNVQQHSGSSVNKQRQEGPHAHSTTVSPDGKYAYACDLGIDKIMIYEIANGKLLANNPASVTIQPGAGPRHFTFHPNGEFAYVINELNASISMFEYNAANGALTTRQTVKTLPSNFYGDNKCADIHISPNGKFLYGSNRGHDSIVIFSIDQETGKLTLVGHQSTGGKTPRNFGIDLTGTLLLAANQDSHNIVVFIINQETGELTQTSEVTVSMPVCVKFMQR